METHSRKIFLVCVLLLFLPRSAHCLPNKTVDGNGSISQITLSGNVTLQLLPQQSPSDGRQTNSWEQSRFSMAQYHAQLQNLQAAYYDKLTLLQQVQQEDQNSIFSMAPSQQNQQTSQQKPLTFCFEVNAQLFFGKFNHHTSINYCLCWSSSKKHSLVEYFWIFITENGCETARA